MTRSSPSTLLARAVVDELARNGMTDACLAPGSRSAPLALALHDDPRIRLHVRIDERSVSFLALGIAKASRRPVAVVCTSGTAAANLHPAVLEADASRVPLLVLTADRPPELRGTGANQTVDQIKLYGAAVRWFCEVGVAETGGDANAYWRSTVCRAWGEASGALTGPPGPVHCNVALREPLTAPPGEPPPGRARARPWTSTRSAPRPPGEADVAEVRGRIAATERGLIVAGDGEVCDPAALLGLAEMAGWPLLAEPQSGLRQGDGAISAYDMLLRDDAFAARHRPELVLRVGRVGLSKALLARLDGGIPQIVVDPHGAWHDPGRSAARVVTADPSLLAAAVAGNLPGRGAGEWLASWLDAEHRVRAAVDATLDAEPAPTEPRTARDLGALAPDGSVLVAASSMPIRDLDGYLRPRRGLRVLANRGASGIDGFVSTALGVAIGSEEGPAFALAGDLSVLHDANGLLASADGADVVIVVVNNDGGGIFSFLPQAELPGGFERLFGTPHGVDLARLAAAYGAGHRRLDIAAELSQALTAARAAGGVQLVEVRTERAANVALHRRLVAAAHAALRS